MSEKKHKNHKDLIETILDVGKHIVIPISPVLIATAFYLGLTSAL